MRIDSERTIIVPILRETMRSLIRKELPDTVQGYRRCYGWPGPELLEALPVFINDLQDDPSSLGWHAWMIIRKKSSLIIGDVGFKGTPDEERVVEIGFSIVPSKRRSGYAVEAVSSMVEYVLSKHGTIRLTAECSPENPGSIKTLEACGFHRSGRIEDNILFRKD